MYLFSKIFVSRRVRTCVLSVVYIYLSCETISNIKLRLNAMYVSAYFSDSHNVIYNNHHLTNGSSNKIIKNNNVHIIILNYIIIVVVIILYII